MKRFLTIKTWWIFSLLFVAELLYAQSNTENYVQSKTCLNDDCTRKSEIITYYDGLGRAKQIIDVKATPTGKDLVTPVTYDGFGRQTKNILPVPAATRNSLIHPTITSESTANTYYGVSNAYSEKDLEKSPLDRVLQQASAGESWKMSSGRTQKYTYAANVAGEVRKFATTTSISTVSGVSTAVTALSLPAGNPGYYPAGTLYKTTLTDEDGNPVIQYENGRGQTLMIRKTDGTRTIDTYYVYNEYNQKAYVITPKAVQQIEQNNNAINGTILNELCYQYRYDGKDREVEKKLPGKDWEFTVYDKQDRAVLVQDGALRTVNNSFNSKGWIFTKYDEMGRVAYTGFFASTATRQVLQNTLNTTTVNPYNNETRSGTSFSQQGIEVYYDKKAYPTANMTLLSLNYYDTYPPEAPNVPPTVLGQYTLPHTLGANDDASTNSFQTAAYLKNIENDSWTKTYHYYDSTGRLIFTNATNHLDGYTRTETELDFVGVVQKKNTYHLRKQGEIGVTVKERFVYDNGNRLLQHFHQVDNNPEQLLAENAYNDLSQLINKKVGGNLQSIDYDYNIRGWLTDINKNQMGVANLGGKLFSYKIKYTDRNGIQNPDSGQFAGKNVMAKYNGNITEVDWRTVETIGVNPSLTPKRYSYVYDGLSRLTAGYYQNPGNPYSKENTESLAYDPNGNILSLYRTSVIENGNTMATVIDNLDYTYQGNQAIKIKDNSANSTGYEGTAGSPIEYDPNGNMKSFMDKQITGITYNYLNLPNTINIGFDQSNSQIITKYRADGVKVSKETTKTSIGVAGTTTSKETTDYLDGFQYYKATSSGNDGGGSEMMMMTKRAYEPQAFTPDDPSIDPPANDGVTIDLKNPELQFFTTAEGFYDYGRNRYIYNYSDHLGNVRVSFTRSRTGALEIVDSNDYYPFGMNHLKTGNAYFGQSSFKNYKFGKKELQETGFYDFGNRMYMNDGVRWMSPDALSEEFPDWSPYNYALNNPIKFTDPDGNAPQEVVENCCQNLKGFVLTVADNVMGTDFRNKYATNSQEYRNGVNNGHGASIALSALMVIDGGASIGGGTAGLALSGAASSTGVGAAPGAAGAALSGGAILKGTIEIAGAGVILGNTIDNMKKDNGNGAKKTPSINSQRQGAVRKAWKEEKNMVDRTGRGTREWTKSETKELKQKGKIKGYQGHHINNVKDHPDQAGDPNNIEFVNRKEHLERHGGNFRNKSTGPLIIRNIEK